MGTHRAAMEASRKRADREAREWLLLQMDHPLSPGEQQRFDEWRRAHLHNAGSYARLDSLWQRLPECKELGAIEPLADETWRERRVRLTGRVLGAFSGFRQMADYGSLVAASLVVLFALATPFVLPMLQQPPPHQQAVLPVTYTTGPGEMKNVTLADGTVLTLGGRTRVVARVSPTKRSVDLREGEAFFSVHHDTVHPFLVSARGTDIRVVGTKFSVNLGGATTRVAVAQGIVEVKESYSAPSTRADTVRLLAGDVITSYRDGSGHFVENVGQDQVAPWLRGWLSYNDVYLADVLADISRYEPVQYRAADADVAKIRVTASFKTSDIDKAMGVILHTFNLEEHKVGEQELLIAKASAKADK